ncbi:MAG: hypothetical protein U1F27_18235 [Turneriella sp.]
MQFRRPAPATLTSRAAPPSPYSLYTWPGKFRLGSANCFDCCRHRFYAGRDFCPCRWGWQLPVVERQFEFFALVEFIVEPVFQFFELLFIPAIKFFWVIFLSAVNFIVFAIAHLLFFHPLSPSLRHFGIFQSNQTELHVSQRRKTGIG